LVQLLDGALQVLAQDALVAVVDQGDARGGQDVRVPDLPDVEFLR